MSTLLSIGEGDPIPASDAAQSGHDRPTRILLVDDHAIVRTGLRALIEREPQLEVCGEAEDGREALRMARRLAPDLVVIDVSMPKLNGIEAARQIRCARPETRIVMLTIHDSDELLNEALALGARGFVLKSDASAELVAGIKAVGMDKFFVSSGIAGTLIGSWLAKLQEGAPAAKERLTPREREIVQLLAEGKPNKEVARLLRIAVKTVETHRTNIHQKIGAHSVAELVRYAVRNKIVEP